MIKNYLLILEQSLHSFPLFMFVFLVICFLIALLGVLFTVILCFLEATYRLNFPGVFNYSMFLDRTCPLLALILPSIIVILFPIKETKHFTYVQILLEIILIHVFILIPLFYIWSKYRKWPFDPSANFLFFDNPLFYYNLAIALIYPNLWGIFLSLIRFIRLGSSINILENNFLFDFFVVFLFLIIFKTTRQTLKSLFELFLILKLFLWLKFTNIIRVLHLYLLRFYFYFKFLEILVKLAFIMGRFISLSADIYPLNKYPKYRYLLQLFYEKPFYSWIPLILFIFLELVFYKGVLYYSLYLLFIYSILYVIINLFYQFYIMPFVTDVCIVDYFNKNWVNPRYPLEFWVSFEDDSVRYSFNWIFTDEELAKIRSLGNIYLSKKYSYRPTLTTRVKNYPYCYRLKAAYKTTYGIRWVHTGRPLHNLTGFVARSFFERGVLVMHNWKHYNFILRAEALGFKTVNVPKDCYQNFDNNFISPMMRELMERNFITNFVPLKKDGVNISIFDNKKILTSQSQAEPDCIFDFSQQTTYTEKRILGLDQKTGHTGIGNGIIFSNITENQYLSCLRKFEATLIYKQLLNAQDLIQIKKGLSKLASSCQDFEQHQKVWATFVKYYP